MRIRTRVYLAVALLSLSACESDEAKIKDLRTAQLTAQLNVDYWERFVGSYPPERLPRYAVDSLNAAHIRLDLANRDLNRFMR